MFNRLNKLLYKRIFVFILGSILMGLGVSIATLGEKGTDSFSTLAIGISNYTPFTIGQASFALTLFLVFVTLFIDRSQISVGTILNPLILGVSTDLFLLLFRKMDLSNSLLVSLLGTLIIGVGIGVYTAANFGKGAYDAITFSLTENLHFKLRYIRLIGDLLFIISGFLLGADVGLATLISIFFIGVVIEKINDLTTSKFIYN